eukprot:9207967-Pyramimonas_sp.AAC.1
MDSSLCPTRPATTGTSARGGGARARLGVAGQAPQRPQRTRTWMHCPATARPGRPRGRGRPGRLRKVLPQRDLRRHAPSRRRAGRQR